MNYYAILNRDMVENGFKLHVGLNKLPDGKSLTLYREHILIQLGSGELIARVELQHNSKASPSESDGSCSANKMMIFAPREWNKCNIVKLLIAEGAYVHILRDCPFRMCAHTGHTDLVKLFLEYDVNIHADNDGALRYAAYNGHHEVVKLLIDNGANLHADEEFALRYASRYRHPKTVKILLENGADPCINGNEPIKSAALHIWGDSPSEGNGGEETIRLLIKYGADKKFKNWFDLI